MSIWNKYSKIKIIETNFSPRINSFIAKKDFIIKKIKFINEEEKMKILGFIESMKNRINIFDIYEDFDFIHIAIDLDNDDSRTFDMEFEKSKKSHFFRQESIPIGHAEYSNFNEIKRFFDKSEDIIFKIAFNLKDSRFIHFGTAFILEIDKKYKLPFKRALFTCYHNIKDETLMYTKDLFMENQNKKDYSISLEESIIYTVSKYEEQNKVKNRKIFSESFNFDYACIELFENEFKEKKPYKISNNYLQNKTGNKDKDIYILHYSEGKDLSFSFGKINKFLNSNILHSVSTKPGASGSPIFFRDDDSVIGLHYAGSPYYNSGYFIDDILLNIGMLYSSIDEIKLIQSTLKDLDFINQNHFIYKKDLNPFKKGEIGNIYFGENEITIKGVLIIEISLIKLTKKIKQENRGIYPRLLSFVIVTIYNTIKRLNNIKDIYIECNSLYIIIENDCMATLEEYYAENKKLNKDEIYSLLIRLNENIQKLDPYNYLGNINLSNILINDIKEYKFLFYYDYIIDGNIIKKANNNYKKSNLADIGDIIDFLFKKYKGKEENKEDKKDFLNIPWRFLKKNTEVKKECFFSIIIEKIKNQFPWDNYYIECQYNIFKKEQKKSIAYLTGQQTTAFFCEIKCKDFPIKKAIITPYISEDTESFYIKFIKGNKEVEEKINLRYRKKFYSSNKDFTCIELYDEDGINNFFIIDEHFFKGKYTDKQIILFQYLDQSSFEDDIYCTVGNIKKTYGEIITSFDFSAETYFCGKGAPIVLSEYSNNVIGVYTGETYGQNLNKAKSINYILKTIKDSLGGCLIL